MIGWRPIRRAIGVAGGDGEGIEDAKAILEIRHRLRQRSCHGSGQIAEGSSKPVAPHLLTEVQVEGLEGLFHGLMAGEAGPFVVSGPGAQPRLLQVGLRLMEPVGAAVHAVIVGRSRRSKRP
jgi:hypothetical protein